MVITNDNIARPKDDASGFGASSTGKSSAELRSGRIGGARARLTMRSITART